MKKIIGYFIKYSVAVNLLILAIAIFGFIGLSRMKSSFFPLFESEFVSVNVIYPGASPEEIVDGIILKIEDKLKGLEGIDRVTSSSRENSGSVTVELKSRENIEIRLDEIKNAIDQIPNFPIGMEPLIIAKQLNYSPAISFALSGDETPVKMLKDIGRTIENDLRKFSNISQINITGYPDEEIEIAVKETALLAYGLSFDEVANAVRNNNIIVTGGEVKTVKEDFLIRAKNRNYFAENLLNIVVRSKPDGSKILLREIAEVRDQFSDSPSRIFYNNERSVNFTILSTNSEDLIEAASTVSDYIETFNQKNNGIQINVLRDNSVYVKERTEILVNNAVAGIALVLLFLSLFLNTRLAFWVAFGLPVSFLGMFIFAPLLGITINIMSLFGLIVVIGILVDDGIVIAENIYHHYEKGKSPWQAALDGTMEVIPPIVSAIITTLLAFSIFFFLESDIGKFFSEVSTIVILTLTISLVEALIILPAHIAHSKALRAKKESKGTEASKRFNIFRRLRKINQKSEQAMNWVRDNYFVPTLTYVINNRFFSFSILMTLMILTIASIGGGIIKSAFFPQIASTQVSIRLEMPKGTNDKITDSIISSIEYSAIAVGNRLTETENLDFPLIENIEKEIGPGSSSAALRINLISQEKRNIPTKEVENQIRERTGVIPGIERLTFDGGTNFGGSPISLSLLGNNVSDLKAAKQELRDALSKISLLKDISDTDPEGVKEVRLELKPSAYALGLNLNSVMRQVRTAFFGAEAQRFQRGQDEIRVWVRYDKNDRNSLNDLSLMRLLTPSGKRVPLREVANYTIARGDVSINRLYNAREIQVNAGIKDPDETGNVIVQIQNEIVPAILEHYPTVSALYEGQSREIGKLASSFSRAAPVLFLLIYLTIAFTFRSYSQPLLLMTMIPFSLVGVAWGHYIHGFPINALSLLGIIALIGIMVNDGLVLISKLNNYLREGMPFKEALIASGRSRFRAIFLTSITTVAGLAPLILEKSFNAQFLIPMAISIAYGIAFATFLTLLVLPLLLSWSNGFKGNIRYLIKGERIAPEKLERAVREIDESTEKK